MADQSVYRPLPTPALYYPYADFQSEAWVKLALLNWDRIERIRPGGYPYEDRRITQQLLDPALGWLEDITPNNWELSRVAEEFMDLLINCRTRLVDRYAVAERDRWPKPKTTFGTLPRGADERLAYVFGGYESLASEDESFSSEDELRESKMIPNLQAQLQRDGLMLRYEVDGATWLGLHPRLASVYMCALTEVIADARGLVPVTDDEAVHRVARRSTLHRLEEALTGGPQTPAKPSPEEVESQYVEIALQSVLNPVNLDELPIERVIEFRGTHKADCGHFKVMYLICAKTSSGSARFWILGRLSTDSGISTRAVQNRSLRSCKISCKASVSVRC